jgi:hypothetical protein
MARPHLSLKALWLGFCAFFPGFLLAHSIPEIPVHADFRRDGTVEVSIEINPRNWAVSPAEAPSLEQKAWAKLTAAQQEDLIRQAAAYVARAVEFRFEPLGRVQPDFVYTFGAEDGKPLYKPDDAVVMVGRWRTTVPAGITGWKIRSLPGHKVSVLFLNSVDGVAQPRVETLFPGEASDVFALAGLTSAPPVAGGAVGGPSGGGWAVFVNFLRSGFVHVVPAGLDHILFVLGLFLLSRTWKPVLTQVTAFTLAHSLTLALAAAGLVRAPAAVVEPVIALSIVFLALENLFYPRYSPWRLLVVFVFGAVHGLGFASGLAEKPIPAGAFLAALTGFNVGVEAAQLTIIALAFAATGWLRDEARYRRWVVIPASVLIAVTGLWWAVERVWF